MEQHCLVFLLVAVSLAEDFKYLIGTRDICFPTIQSEKITPGPNEELVGLALGLSSDGTILVVSDSQNSDPDAFGGFLSYIQNPLTHQYEPESLAVIHGNDFDVHGDERQGGSLTISADGSTVAMGSASSDASSDFSNAVTGAVWVFIRNLTDERHWSQQGAKFTGPFYDPANNKSCVGYSVTLSGQGHTLAYGGPLEEGPDGVSGAVWIYNRDPVTSIWTFQTKKIGTNNSFFGFDVHLSYDGNILAVGSPDGWDLNNVVAPFSDASNPGGVWIFLRSNTNWVSILPRLVGVSPFPVISQGSTMDFSEDGRTLIVSGVNNLTDLVHTVFVWLATPNRSYWYQQQVINIAPNPDAGLSHPITLSGDGNVLAVGAYGVTLTGDSGVGLYARNLKSNLFNPQGCKNQLLASGTIGPFSGQGSFDSAFSYTGKNLVVGAPLDNAQTGAVFVFGGAALTNGSQTDCLVHELLKAGGKSLYFKISCPLDLYWVSDQPDCALTSRVGPFPLVRDNCFQAQFSATIYASSYLTIHCTCPKGQYQNVQGACVAQRATVVSVLGLNTVGSIKYLASNQNLKIKVANAVVVNGAPIPTGGVHVNRKDGNTWTALGFFQLVNGQFTFSTVDAPNTYQGSITFRLNYEGDNFHAPSVGNFTILFYRFPITGAYLISSANAVVGHTVTYYGLAGAWTAENGFGNVISPFNGWTPNKNLSLSCGTNFSVSKADTPQVFDYVGVVVVKTIGPKPYHTTIQHIAVIDDTADPAVGKGKILAVLCPS